MRLLCIGTMHRLAFVSQRFLRESFWIAHRLCPLRPRIAVTVQTDSLDLQNAAPATKFSGTSTDGGFSQGWEQHPLLWQSSKNPFQPAADSDIRPHAGFSALVGK